MEDFNYTEKQLRFLNKPLDSHDYSARSFNRLKANKIDTGGKLIKLDRSDLSNIRGLGEKSIVEILNSISENQKKFIADASHELRTPLTVIQTNIEVLRMKEDEVLILANRSSNPGKKGLILANSIGVIDSDYYGNPDNDGHIMFAFYNIKEEDIEIKKGEAIGQGIFQKFLSIDNDISMGERTGGFGSTSK